MKRALILFFAVCLVCCAEARSIGFGVDAFNRVIASPVSHAAVFSPISFEIDCVAFAEAVDPIRRSIFTEALGVRDEFAEEYSVIARKPFENSGTNGLDVVWSHAFILDNPYRIDSSYRVSLQTVYGIEMCDMHRPRGVEAWVRTRFSGAFDDWCLPALPKGKVFALHDIVSLSAQAAPSNGWKRICPTHTLYRQPLEGGVDFYALVPKAGRPISSVRGRLTSVTLSEILAQSNVVIDPPTPVRLELPTADFVTTNDLAGAFSYFRFPTTALKTFPPEMQPVLLRQTMRFRFIKAETALPAAAGKVETERLKGPFLFFVHDPVANTLPAIGIIPGQQ